MVPTRSLQSLQYFLGATGTVPAQAASALRERRRSDPQIQSRARGLPQPAKPHSRAQAFRFDTPKSRDPKILTAERLEIQTSSHTEISSSRRPQLWSSQKSHVVIR